MAKSRQRYPLVIYTHMMDRWRPWVFWLGVLLLGIGGIVYYRGMEQWRWMAFGIVGLISIFASFIMWVVRKSAYVQLFPAYMKLATPFLRLNISYKRFRRLGPANMGALFPPKSVSSAQREIVEQIAGMTAVVIELTGHPMSQTLLRVFLSPLFFKDKTPHIVILVEDWMRFSSEIDSYRSGSSGGPARLQPQQPQAQPPQPKVSKSSSILTKLPPKK